MTARRPLTRVQKVRIFDRWSGMCLRCRLPIHAERGEKWEVDHLTPLHMGGADDETNLVPIHERCHDRKNAEENTVRSKTDRQRANLLGVKKKVAKPLPAGRHSSATKTFNNGVQPRVKGRGAKDRAVIARRQIGFEP